MPEARNAILQRLRAELGADALWITSLPHIRWACGFSGSNGILISRDDTAHFVSDGRYATQARAEVRGAEVHISGPDLIDHAADKDLLRGCRRVVFESDDVTVSTLGKVEDAFPDVDWSGKRDLLTRIVASKDPEEVRRIRAAQEITDAVFERLLDWLGPGLTEKQIAAEIVYEHLKRGAERMSFEPIVASGPNSALPHARPSDRQVQRGDVLLLDFGCVVDGYASDMTRTVAMGNVDSEARHIYDIVLEAQMKAIEQARSGMASNTLDGLARSVIEQSGFGDAFSHGLGHGVGLQTHEWPRVSYSVEYPLPRDVVVSIEPGIYLPDRFGVRIEDLVVLRENGAEVLTTASKEWTVL